MDRTAWLMAVLLLAQDAPPPQQERTGIAARVNDEIITWDELRLKAERLPPGDDREKLLQAELRRTVDERLFLHEAKRLQLAVREEEIDQAIDRMKKTQLSRPGESKDVIERRFQERLKFQGITLAEFREQLGRELLKNAVYRRMMFDSVRNPSLYTTLVTEFVSPEETKAYYDSHPDEFKPIFYVTALRIGLNFTAADREEKRRTLESLRRKLDAGAEFRVLAGYYSDLKGMDLRELRKENSEFAPETNRILFDELAEGQVSGIVEDGHTLNLFKLIVRHDEKGRSYEEAQEAIRSQLENARREQNRTVLRQALLQQYYVEPAGLFEP